MPAPEVQPPLVIVGGGPAGCAAALTLRRWLPEIPVALVERRAVPGHAPEVGETLTPGVRPLLDHLGLGTHFHDLDPLPAGGTASAWNQDQPWHRPYLFTGLGEGWQIDRRRFDDALFAAALAAGVSRISAPVTGVRRDGTGFRLELGGAGELAAAGLIDATGRPARLARALGARVEAEDPLVARVAWYHQTGSEATSEGALIASFAEGWWYAARLPGGRGVLMMMTDAATVQREAADADGHWSRSLAACPAVVERVRGWIPTGERATRPAGSQVTIDPAGPGWVAAGDAAAAFDPLASLGIGFALRSGIEAARVAVAQREGDATHADAYVQSARGIVADYRARLRGFYALESRFDTPFWRSRAAGGHGYV